MSAGGIKRMYMTNWQDLRDSLVFSGEIILDITTILAWFEIEVVRSKVKLSEKSEVTPNNSRFTSTFQVFLPKMDAKTNNKLDLLLRNRIIVMYQDYNGVWFLSGLNAGGEVQGYSAGSGDSGGENGYNFTIIADEFTANNEVSNLYYENNILVPGDICDTNANQGAELGNNTPLWQIANCIFYD